MSLWDKASGWVGDAYNSASNLFGGGETGGGFAGGLFGTALFGPMGTIPGALSGRGMAQYQKQMQRAQNMAASVPQPQYPGYDNILSKDMTLPSQYQVAMNPTAMAALREEAFREGPSPWATMMSNLQNERYQQAVGNLGQQTNTAVQGMQSAIARTGGLSGGASDRIQQEANRQRMFALQGLGTERDVGLAEINLQDLAQQQATLEALPGLEIAALQPQQWNIEQVLAEKARQEEALMQKYKTEMEGFARAKTAGAIATSPDYGILDFLYA